MPVQSTEQIEIVVVRGFFISGVPQARGQRLTVPEPLGFALIQSGKATRAPAGEPSAPPAPESAQAPAAETPETRGRRRGGAARAEGD